MVLLHLAFSSFVTTDNASTKLALMKIGRSIDVNEIHYFVQVDNQGKLFKQNPVEVYWMNFEDKGQKEEMNWIKKKFGYGLNYLNVTDTSARFQFVSYKERDFFVKRNKNKDFRIFTSSGGREVEVNRIFIQIDGGSFWIPNITKVELHATDAETGMKILEIVRK